MFPDENARLVDTVPTKLRKQETNLQIENTHLANIHIFKFKTDEVTPVARLGNNTALHGHSWTFHSDGTLYMYDVSRLFLAV